MPDAGADEEDDEDIRALQQRAADKAELSLGAANLYEVSIISILAIF